MSRKISSLKGKRIARITSAAGYFTLHLETDTGRAAGQITVRADATFDKDGEPFEDNT